MSDYDEPEAQPTGVPEPHDGEHGERGAHNRLGFYDDDEEAPKDESPGPQETPDRDPDAGGGAKGTVGP
jgi:hypothetical protein